MKIVHLNFTFRQGGIPALLVDITNLQVETDQVEIIIINNQVHEEMLAELNPKVKIHLIKRQPGSKNPFPVLKLNYLLQRLNPDVIHCHGETCIKYLFPAFRKRAVLTVHDTLIQDALHSKFRKVFAISEAVRQDVLNRFGIQSEVVYNGINTSNIKLKNEKNKSGTFKIVQIGRLVTQIKGQHISIEAIRKLVYEHSFTNIHLDFIGWGDDFDCLNKMVTDYRLENYISFLGLKDRPYIYSHLCNYDLMVHPSFNEGFGLNIAEAMTAKVPVLVSDSEGPMEVIDNGNYGFYFKTGNSDDLANKLFVFLQNENSGTIDHTIEKAYEHVIANFDIKNTVRGYLHGYTQAIKR